MKILSDIRLQCILTLFAYRIHIIGIVLSTRLFVDINSKAVLGDRHFFFFFLIIRKYNVHKENVQLLDVNKTYQVRVQNLRDAIIKTGSKLGKSSKPVNRKKEPVPSPPTTHTPTRVQLMHATHRIWKSETVYLNQNSSRK